MAQQIRDTNVVKTPEVVINPAFFLPPDVIDMRTYVEDDFESNDVEISEVLDVDDADDVSFEDSPSTDDDAPDDTAGLAAPDGFTIVEQIVRIAPDGNSVVDVVIEFNDEASMEYDIRVTKAVS
ncbi:hypothetical protein PP459_gp203 [Streptomyces phage Wakanda]|uniref:Uncharacterized protein n=1 Tax=Streptomyces phage Wakanda TaxID=2713267 RepID=A0A6G8R1I8_9CAUD|nr:hypothetical protein PP459_gp203 [Streptomyces phage Wakanda]QIN94031.1 hypothetical protein SEA_WAKANDA_38 [Streptomyces phage Wakanda]